MRRERLLSIVCSVLLAFTSGCQNFSRPSDEAMVTGIEAKMFSDPALKASSITVTAKDGVVKLSGTVADQAARQSAQKIASDAKGVSKIIDQTTLATALADSAPVAPTSSRPHPAAEPKRARASVAADQRRQFAAQEQQVREAPRPPITSTDVMPAPAPAADPGPIVPQTVATLAPPATPPAPPKPEPVTTTIPEGTVLSVRTVEPIDSKVNTTGQTFKASLDAPILVENKVVVPKDLNVTLELITASSAGRLSGSSELTISLQSFTLQGKTYTIASSDVQQKGASRGKRSAAVIGGGAVLGAIIGGIAGGGKGAAIGAAAGGGGGAAVQALTRGQQVKIPAETKLDFTLHAPLAITYLPVKRAPRPDPDAALQEAPPTKVTPPAQPAAAPPVATDPPPNSPEFH